MIHKAEYPILEFDDNPVAKLNPANFADSKFDTDKMIITFFPEVVLSGRIGWLRPCKESRPRW